ncbi:MurR/RpiR family transcriptional regulator [Rhodococcus sp. NPDC059968]|uniref:MurR/RpiR family transcriptional regulator n=1 Tax=Rhodococcus sp. NPDC059968 TaxID=3347017 RepID=UPI00366DB33A
MNNGEKFRSNRQEEELSSTARVTRSKLARVTAKIRTQPNPTRLRTGEVAARIQAARAQMVPSALKFVGLVLEDPQGVLTSSVSEAADRAGTSESTVIRACQGLGFKGFHDLKLALASDLATQDVESYELERAEGITSRTPRREVPRRVLRSSAAVLQDAVRTLDLDAYEGALDALASARRILVIGNGTSSAPARDCAYRLTTLGLLVHSPSDTFGQNLIARALEERDAVLAISHTGATKETLHAVEAAHDRGASVVAVTSYLRSPLTNHADHVLVAGGPELGFRQEAMTSRLAHLAVLDTIFVGIALCRPKRAREFLDVMSEVTAEHSL